MNDGFAWWLVVLGVAIGVGLSWLVLGRLPRAEADVDQEERAVEAIWISRTIADDGGVAPPALVEEVLELHGQYLQGAPLADDASRSRETGELYGPAQDQPVDPEVRTPR